MEFKSEEIFPTLDANTYEIIEVGSDKLLVAPQIPSWLLINPIQMQLWETMQKGTTIGEAVYEIATNEKYDIDMLIKEIQVLASMAINNGFYQGYTASKRKFASELIMYLTESCNLSCKHCFVSSESNVEKKNISTNKWLEFIDEYSNLKKGEKVLFTGGEPLLCQNLVKLVKHAGFRGLKVSINTNGILLTEELLKNLRDYLYGIQISIDGFTRKVHEDIRGNGTFDQTIKSIKMALSICCNSIVRISVSVFPSSYNNIKMNMLRVLKEIDPNRQLVIIFNPVAPIGRATGKKMSTSIEEIEDSLRTVISQLTNEGWAYESINSPGVYQDKCGIGEYLVVHSDGSISPCNFSPEQKQFDNLNAAFEYYKSKYGQNVVANSKKCSSCVWRFICYMGCQIRNNVEGEGMLSPECSLGRKKMVLNNIIFREHKHREEILQEIN